MAALLDPGSPGDAQQPDPALVQAYGSGYSYGEVANYHDANGLDAPSQPNLTDLWSGKSVEQAQWSSPSDFLTSEDQVQHDYTPGEAAETIGGAAAGAAVGPLVGAALKAIPGVLADVSGELAPSVRGFVHGSDTALTPDMMQAGRSLWVSDNPGVAKNLGGVLHDVTLRPGDVVDVTEEALKQAGSRDPQAVQRALYDISYDRQLTSPETKYLQADVPGSGTVRIVQNQRRDVLDIAARKR